MPLNYWYYIKKPVMLPLTLITVGLINVGIPRAHRGAAHEVPEYLTGVRGDARAEIV
jgi:hypothetical protein